MTARGCDTGPCTRMDGLHRTVLFVSAIFAINVGVVSAGTINTGRSERFDVGQDDHRQQYDRRDSVAVSSVFRGESHRSDAASVRGERHSPHRARLWRIACGITDREEVRMLVGLRARQNSILRSRRFRGDEAIGRLFDVLGRGGLMRWPLDVVSRSGFLVAGLSTADPSAPRVDRGSVLPRTDGRGR